ncbi:MAG: FadR family transcriptional regulator [Xanthomonadales bacterium]|nr:FadR family transcriptional regulator [Gammaproteobacteria bacterium]NNJ80504.1 FadR family transcriptional regulator [Xanthomonadales bacterium]MBT8051053.1 FadR family transcriptional regulator [Gammaproteobacteria bacterium]MBT8074013.1 FadR family transcriptional regulator [Gammaproteobacteria bacterium]NNK04863.1 FadR family transcriptional regulator [Xanthomonadales bacterium]
MANAKRLYRDVLEKMLELIDSGEFPAGGRLPPERELAERFNVSRPTVREAIIALEALERVNVKTGSGVYVLDHPDLSGNSYYSMSPFELTEARALIEGEAAALAAKMITEEELEALKETLEKMSRESDTGDLADGDADREFHHLIALATRNRMIQLIIDQLWFVRNNAPQVHKAYKTICDEDGHKRVEEHREIYEALAHGDSEAARTAMHWHFSRILNKLISTSEAEEFEKIKRQSEQVRKRFSLDHLVSGDPRRPYEEERFRNN